MTDLSLHISKITGVHGALGRWQPLRCCKICLRLSPFLAEISVAALIDQFAHVLPMAAGPDGRLVHGSGWITQEVRLHHEEDTCKGCSQHECYWQETSLGLEGHITKLTADKEAHFLQHVRQRTRDVSVDRACQAACGSLPLRRWRWEGHLSHQCSIQNAQVSRCLLRQSPLEADWKTCYDCLTLRGCVQSLQHRSCTHMRHLSISCSCSHPLCRSS